MSTEHQLNQNTRETLPSLLVDNERVKLLKELSLNLKDISLNAWQLCDFELLACGALFPLSGFMVKDDYESVMYSNRLQNKHFWPLPICLDIEKLVAHSLEVGQSLALRDPEGFLLAIMHLEDIWPIDKENEAKAIYGCVDEAHPGVKHLFENIGDFYIGGKLEVISLPLHYNFQQYRKSPQEVRDVFSNLKWNRVVGFQTRNLIHRPQFELILNAMRTAKANVLLLPSAGVGRPAEFDHYTRIRCYLNAMHRFPADSHILNILPMTSRFAGPKEALLHAIIAKNYGCSHFVIGSNHASPKPEYAGDLYYQDNYSQDLATDHKNDLDIELLPFNELKYLPFEDEFRESDKIPIETQTISLSGTDIHKRVRKGKRIPDWFTFPEVIDELSKAYPPPNQQGFTIFFTGLSGSGKSTIAKILYSRFLETGDRPVTLLDGDIVRHHLSRELSFSREHRNINVRRIGFVASEITKNGGIAICAPIAPYTDIRREVRSMVELHGGFIEVHIATPIDECEKRDRKGMYAKARAGLIKGFTGVDDPYEQPQNPEVRIDTTELLPNEAAQVVLVDLSQKGYI